MESREEPLSPADALVAIQGTRNVIADQRMQPRWFEICLALFVAVEMLVQLIPSGVWHAVGLFLPLVVILGADLVVRSRSPYVATTRQRWPFWGLRLLLIVAVDGLVALGRVAVQASGARWLWLVIAVVVFVLVLSVLHRLDRAWVAWLRSGR
ncbi:MAG TPA: hypothetical protein VHX38_05620 [Pseudonocardiaceae bacterium]|jgi:hypothetical protein|nr:hypothetical protein [Pseudonocardiaceae bacterium]